MINWTVASITGARLNGMERDALQSLRTAYKAEAHIFTAQELVRLSFMRWLVQSPGWKKSLDRRYRGATR